MQRRQFGLTQAIQNGCCTSEQKLGTFLIFTSTPVKIETGRKYTGGCEDTSKTTATTKNNRA